MNEPQVAHHISVAMPCYNAASCLDETVARVLRQSHPFGALVIVEEEPTDGSPKILPRLGSEHPELISLVCRNRAGSFANRKLTHSHADGNLAAFLNADDICRPDVLRLVNKVLEAVSAGIAQHAVRVPQRDDPKAVINNAWLWEKHPIYISSHTKP